MNNIVLQLKNISKQFVGVKALDDMSLNVYHSKVMAVMGENGAGKSTLMKIITGIYTKDAGEMFINGELLHFKGVKDSQKYGIGIIHQELNLIPELPVYENIFLAREKTNKFGKINKKLMLEKTQNILDYLNFNVPIYEKVKNLSIGEQQIVEIAKCLSMEAYIIIMDEPTDALTKKEADKLFMIIENLKKQGRSILYISHRLEEIFKIADDVTVIRDGKFIAESKVSDITEEKLIQMMVGRSIEQQFPYTQTQKGNVILEVKNLNNKYVKNINLNAYEGEVLGLAGLIGSGRTELAKTILGVYNYETGDISIFGKKYKKKSIIEALKHHIVYVSEDRKTEGLILSSSVKHNMILSFLACVKKKFNIKMENNIVKKYIKNLRIKTPTPNKIIEELSGGNQQKISISKALIVNPKLLILDEPTRGIDVGAKKEIYTLINQLKQEGITIILISSEMPEIMGISDRIIVMHDGHISGEISKENFSSEKIMELAIK